MTDKDFVDFDYGDCANCQYRADYTVPVDREVVETYSECSLLCRGKRDDEPCPLEND